MQGTQNSGFRKDVGVFLVRYKPQDRDQVAAQHDRQLGLVGQKRHLIHQRADTSAASALPSNLNCVATTQKSCHSARCTGSEGPLGWSISAFTCDASWISELVLKSGAWAKR
jgi:hypothetical protein